LEKRDLLKKAFKWTVFYSCPSQIVARSVAALETSATIHKRQNNRFWRPNNLKVWSIHTTHYEPQSRSVRICVHVPLVCGTLAGRANHEFPSFGSSEGFLVGNVGKNDESQIQNEFYGPKLSALWTRTRIGWQSKDSRLPSKGSWCGGLHSVQRPRTCPDLAEML